MGCWGPANEHFQSISSVAQRDLTKDGAVFSGFYEAETETVLHFAHHLQRVGLLDLFYEATGADRGWELPVDDGRPDPYLTPRGGTKQKKSNRLVRR
jgi:hypothetical protein